MKSPNGKSPSKKTNEPPKKKAKKTKGNEDFGEPTIEYEIDETEIKVEVEGLIEGVPTSQQEVVTGAGNGPPQPVGECSDRENNERCWYQC